MSQIIEKVVKEQLCVSCGTCEGVCPTSAIVMQLDERDSNYFPVIDKSACINCGRCGLICPGENIDFNHLRAFIQESTHNDPLIGEYIRCYRGHSADEKIRFDSTSGGIITSLLISLIRREIIDGVIVIKMREDNPLETMATLACTESEVLEAARSKYCPAAPNILLNKIKEAEGKYAIVGLPCQLHGIRKAELLDEAFKDKIILHLGLMCSHTVNFAGTDLVLEKLGIEKSKVKDIAYRGYGWPGGLKGSTCDGKEFFIPLFGEWRAYWPIFSSFFFSPIRCLMCPDQTADYADISFGDAWLPEASDDKIGESVIVTRTSFSDSILNKLNDDGEILIDEIDYKRVIKSQIVNLKFKKEDLSTRLRLLKILGYKTPTYTGLKEYRFSIVGMLKGMYAIFNVKMSNNKFFRIILRYIPFPIFRLYFGIYKILSII